MSSRTRRHVTAAFVPILLLAASAGVLRAQSQPVIELFRAVWGDGASAALDDYAPLYFSTMTRWVADRFVPTASIP